MDSSILILGILAGGGWMFSRTGRMAGRGPYWMYKWFHPRSQYGDARSIKRLKKALNPAKSDHRWGMFNALPMALAISLGFIFLGGEPDMIGFGIGLGAGFVGAGILSISTNTLKQYNMQVITYAAKEVARRLHPRVANDCLLPLAQHSDQSIREAVLPALRALGTPEAVDAIDYIRRNALNPNLIQEARQAGGQLLALSSGESKPLPVSNMDALAADHARLFPYMGKGKKTKEHERDRSRLEDLETAMDELVFSQLTLRRSFPDLFCRECYTRSEIFAYEGWSWVRCKRCHEATHLVPNVAHAIGVIGAAENWHLENGQLRVHLWDEATRQASAAEIRALEVVAGHAIHYDWAVSAVVSKLESQGYTEDGRVEVQLINRPPLEANSLNLLRMVDPRVQAIDVAEEWSIHDSVPAPHLPGSQAPVVGEEPF